MRFPGAPETVKMACGENPKRVYGERRQAPMTRMGNLRAQREAFLAAQDWLETWQKYEENQASYEEWLALPEKKRKKDKKKKPDMPKRDLDKETLALVLTGQVLPQIHCYRADDMLSMLQLAEEFGFLGATGLLLLWVIILVWGLIIARSSASLFGRFAAAGCVATVAFFILFNVAMVLGLVPVVGVPLPLISYGGTVMFTTMACFGIIMSVHLGRDERLSSQGVI